MTALTKSDTPGALLETAQLIAAVEGDIDNIQIEPDLEAGTVTVNYTFPGSLTIAADGSMSLVADDYAPVADFDATSALGAVRGNAAAALVELTSNAITANAGLPEADLPEEVDFSLTADLSDGSISGNFTIPVTTGLVGGNLSIVATDYLA